MTKTSLPGHSIRDKSRAAKAALVLLGLTTQGEGALVTTLDQELIRATTVPGYQVAATFESGPNQIYLSAATVLMDPSDSFSAATVGVSVIDLRSGESYGSFGVDNVTDGFREQTMSALGLITVPANTPFAIHIAESLGNSEYGLVERSSNTFGNEVDFRGTVYVYRNFEGASALSNTLGDLGISLQGGIVSGGEMIPVGQQVSPVPEPSTTILLLGGMSSLFMLRRRV